MLRPLPALALSLVVATTSLAGPFDVPLDPGQSTLSIELCIAGNCDTDATPVSGTVRIELDSVESPSQIWLHDFHFLFDETLDWHLSWSIFGAFDGTVSGGGVHYVSSNGLLGPVPITAGEYAFPGVPATTEGLLAYVASGVPCLALQASGLPCTGLADLGADGNEVIADTFGGAVASVDRVVSISVEGLDVTLPLDETNPDLGTLHVVGSVYGQVNVPRPGDFDDDGDVDVDDYVVFADCLAGPDAVPAPALPGVTSEDCLSAFDIDQGGDVDASDFAAFQEALDPL